MHIIFLFSYLHYQKEFQFDFFLVPSTTYMIRAFWRSNELGLVSGATLVCSIIFLLIHFQIQTNASDTARCESAAELLVEC